MRWYIVFLLIFLVNAKRVAQNQGSSEVEGDRTMIPDKFDQPSYGFMLPEGYSENSTLLAVVDFITRRDSPAPKIVVNFDELGWFDIGGVQKTKADNADVYSATVILKPGSNVKIDQTDEGIYKFVVEAQMGDNVLATTNVVVEILALAPTTRRAKVTEDPIEISSVQLTPVEEEFVLSATTEISSTTLEVLTTTEAESSTTTSAAEEETTTTAEVPSETSTEPTTPETKPSTEVQETTTSEVVPETSTEPTTLEEETRITESQETTTSTTSETTTELQTTESTTTEPTEIPVFTESSGSDQEVPTTTPTPDEFLEASGTQSTEEFTTESSGELLTDESPIEGPITILPLSNHHEIEAVDLELDVQGVAKVVDNDVGSQIRGVVIIPRSNNKGVVKLMIEPEGVQVRPTVLRVGEPAGLFIGENFNASKSFEIVAKLSNGAIVRQPLNIEVEQKQRNSEQTRRAHELKEIEFNVVENAENGKTIGTIEENDMRIVGDQQRFSLVGKSIILTCSQFENEKCLENSPRNFFTLMLLPKNGTLAPYQVTIKVLKISGNNLRTSDNIVRVSDNRIITPFVVFADSDPVLNGTAARFLGIRKTSNMYQIQVINSAASGKYNLEIQSGTSKKEVMVFVENSQSHAHFRKPKYFAKIDSSKILEGKRITQVELEGVPIDEAKIIIIDGNPGWVTVEGYGGRVKVNSYNGEVYQGKYTVRIGAIDKKTFTILTETELEIEVINGKEREVKKPKISTRLVEITFDREKEKKFEVALDGNEYTLMEDPFAIDENGKRVSYEPMNIKIGNGVAGIKNVENLRIVSFNLMSERTKLIVLIRLVSSPAYLERQEKLRAKPIYQNEIIEVNMKEEMRKGSIVGVFPAVIPTTNQRTKSRIEGEMKEAFDFDGETGELRVKQVIDYESLTPEQRSFDLKLISGEKGFETEGIVRINVVDIDDNSPSITREEINTVSLPEDLPSGSKIAEFDVKDPDGSTRFDVSLDGRGSQNYFANVTDNGVLSIYLASDGKLDREVEDSNALIVKVQDVSGNSDRILIPIQIVDVNDNSPNFSKKVYEVEAVENWPQGVVLEKIQATDPDLGKSGQVKYFLEGTPKLLKINETSGVVTIAEDIMGLSRAEPYILRIIAQDSGTPPLNSSVLLNLRIRSKDELMSQPIVEFINLKNRLEIEENISDSTKIVKIEARVKGSRENSDELEYSLKDLISDVQSFQIDKTTGEVFASRPIDYEEQQEYTVTLLPKHRLS